MQGLLARGRDVLAGEGVTVVLRRDLERDAWLRPLRALPRARLRPLVAAWALARASGETVLLSEENLFGPMPGHRGAAFYPGHARALRGMERLGLAFDVAVRWIVRRQDRFLESLWAFRVGRGLVDDFRTFAAPLAGTLHWLPIARALAVARLDAKIAVFEDLFASGREGPVAAFLDLPPRAVGRRSLRRGNAALWGPLLWVLLHVNRHAPPPAASRRKVVEALRAIAPADGLPSPIAIETAFAHAGCPRPRSVIEAAVAFAASRGAPGFDASARRAFLVPYEAGNRALFRMSILQGDGTAWETGVISSRR